MSSSMEFWGVEVKAGQPLKVTPEDDVILHLSHAALGEAKKTKENEFVPLTIQVDGKKLVLGTLAPGTIPQLAFDLVLEKEFELSHNWKNGSVYFTGYKSILPEDDEEFSDFGSEEEEEEEVPVAVPVVKAENGKVQKVKSAAPAAKAAAAKPEAGKPKSKPAAVPAKPENESDDSDDSDDDSDDSDESDDESGEDMSVDAGVDSDASDDDLSDGSDEEETPTPKKPEQGKKRSNDSAVKTPVPAKKAKQATPQKTDGKKAAHTATPHPAKNAAKTAGSAAKTPKSGGEFGCKSCDRTFGSDGALQSHAKAKHTAK